MTRAPSGRPRRRLPPPPVDVGPDSWPLWRDPLLYSVALVAVLSCVPFVRVVPWLGDEGVFLHAAMRMLSGDTLYRDFFEFLPPGSFLTVAVWMKLFGASLASVRILAIGTIAATAVLLYVSVRLASGSGILAALLAVAWIMFTKGAWIVIGHHWFATALSMASAVCLLVAADRESRETAAVGAGLFAGAAAMVTQTRGALLCLGIVAVLLTLPRASALLVRAVAGIALLPVAMLLYVAASGTLAHAFDQVILYPMRHYAGTQTVSFGHYAGRNDIGAVVFFPITFVLAGITVALTRGTIWKTPRWRAALALALVGLLGAYPRPDVSHLHFTVPLGCPLFALSVMDLLRRLRRPLPATVGAVLIGLSLAAVVYGTVIRFTPVPDLTREVPTPRGIVVNRPTQWTEDLASIVIYLEHVPPGDGVFFYPYIPMLPYLTARRHVAAVDIMLPAYTTVEHYRDTCTRVMQTARFIVVERSWSRPDKIRYLFPAIIDPDPPERRAFEAALETGFGKVIHASASFELRERTDKAGTALCDAISPNRPSADRGVGPREPWLS